MGLPTLGTSSTPHVGCIGVDLHRIRRRKRNRDAQTGPFRRPIILSDARPLPSKGNVSMAPGVECSGCFKNGLIMAPRANWKGVIRIGDVISPVALYTAASTSERIAF